MPGAFVITEACVDVKDRGCVDVCPVQCIYELRTNGSSHLVSEEQAGDGQVVNDHPVNPEMADLFGDSMLYINPDECTSCTACLPECPVGAIYIVDEVPDGTPAHPHHKSDPWKDADESFFVQLNHDIFADIS